MNSVFVLQLIGALGGGALIQGLIIYFRDRRQIKIRDEVAEHTEVFQVETVGMAAMQAKLVYLQGVIDSVDAHNKRLELDNTNKEDQIQRQWARIRELESELQEIRLKARELDDKCHRLEVKMREFTQGV